MNSLYATKAEKYAKYRWDYAAEAIVAIFDIVGISKQTIVAVLTLAGKVAQAVGMSPVGILAGLQAGI